MFILVCYDIADRRRLYRVARALEGYGERVQESVFECHLERARLSALQRELAGIIDAEADRIHYYRLCDRDRKNVQWLGPGCAPRDTTLWQV